MDLLGAIGKWQALLGTDQVVLQEASARAYGVDASGFERRIPAALRILDASFLPEVMRIAQAHLVPVYPISTGRNWGYGTALPARDNCVVIDLGGLRKILHFDAELGVVTLEPGVTQGMLVDFLDAGNHNYLVPVTGAGPSCSVLANALERGYGITPYVDHFGATTDIEAVLADGTLYRTALREAGGEELARLFKWGIGPYSAGLFTQSGFGIVTRMSIILARSPECIKVCLFSLQHDALLEEAVLRIRNIMGRLSGTVGGINLMNQRRVHAADAKVLILGLTFKENCPDLRNTRVVDVVAEFKSYNAEVDVYDPWVDRAEAKAEYGFELLTELPQAHYDAVILAVSHHQFISMGAAGIRALGKPGAVLFDVKQALPRDAVDGRL